MVCELRPYPAQWRGHSLGLAVALCAATLLADAARAEQPTAHPALQVTSQTKSIIVTAGYIEWATLEGLSLKIRAKLDTGAQSSSLNAIDMASFTKDERPWVRFSILNEAGQKTTIERPIVRTAKIHRANTAVSERPVVGLHICVAGKSGHAEVTLANRKGMKYALLIGRSFLRNRILVDSATTYLGDGRCAMVKP